MTYLAAAIIALWAAYGVFGPWVVSGTRNRHTAIRVTTNAKPVDSDKNHQPSVLVQEVGEWKLCKIVGVTLGLIALPFNPIVAVVVLLLGDAFMRFVPAQDAAGHGAEIIAAEKAGLTGYRDEEINRLIYQKDWPNTRSEISDRLNRWNWLARFVYKLGQ